MRLATPLLIAFWSRTDSVSSFRNGLFSRAFADPSCSSVAPGKPSKHGQNDEHSMGCVSPIFANPSATTEESKQREEGSEKKNNAVIAKFSAMKQATSENAPSPPPGKTLDLFFNSAEHRNLLFSADAELHEIEQPSERQMELFLHESSLGRLAAGLPAVDEQAITKLVQIRNPAMQFVGVKLTSIVTVGTQLILGMDSMGKPKDGIPRPGFPEFQFTLLDSTFEADGPRALVWLFNKLMGRGRDDNDDMDPDGNGSAQKTSGFTRVWAEPAEDNMIVFCTLARLESQLRIPRLLIRLLPVTLEKMEKQGSEAMQKSVEKDVEPAMERFRSAYEEWIES